MFGTDVKVGPVTRVKLLSVYLELPKKHHRHADGVRAIIGDPPETSPGIEPAHFMCDQFRLIGMPVSDLE
jgi:hypothetical protein